MKSYLSQEYIGYNGKGIKIIIGELISCRMLINCMLHESE